MIQTVLELKPYEDDLISCKLECVCHIQKRLGTRLRKLQNDMRGKKLSDGKGFAGKGRLTDKLINKFQNYYGLAIPQNTTIQKQRQRKSYI